ncbi:VWA domain-containing protein [Vibrio sp. ED004]|uniref:TadE/TadG family type IV pilus assembly protein n=2 Tax=unclassified Vibrio TaxID=2614977 RepID=UPI00205E9891|nr:vWA domain-containing protein [Vibrio sp. ED004]UPR58176.1 VWA domain-containing protein [Vibrio sp. ED004]
MRHRLRKQKGHMILFVVLFAGCLYGIASLGIDGARAIQNKARLADATETATLAISASSDNDLTVNRKLANRYIDEYIQDKTNNTVIQIDRNECISSNQMNCDSGTRYSEVKINVETQHNSWFPGTNDIVGFKRTYEVNGFGTVRKYQGDAIDIVFATDMSSSMTSDWGYSKKTRIAQIRTIINSIADQIALYNKERVFTRDVNRIAIVPFGRYVLEQRSGHQYRNCRGTDWQYAYVQDQWEGSISSTVRGTWKTKRTKHVCVWLVGGMYYSIGLTDNVNVIKSTFSRFIPGGNTHSYQGLIKSAQILRNVSNPNPRQLIVVLSDGQDTDLNRFSMLTKNKLCANILGELNSRKTISGKPITASIAFIAFDYKNKGKDTLDCYGPKNVYDATTPNDLLKIIYNLISEEIGTLK